MPSKAQCLCGQVKAEIGQAPQMMAKCHCRDCQYISGGEAASFAFFPEDSLQVSGKLKTYSVEGSSGKQVHRSFCPECGTHFYSKVDVVEGMVFVKAGTLDKATRVELKTAVVFWASNANSFCHLDEGAQILQKNT